MVERLHEEVTRLRDRQHDLVSRVVALELRTKGVLEMLTRLDQAVEGLARKDEIADAVADKLHERRGFVVKAWQAILAGAVSLIVIVSALFSLWDHLT